MSNMQNIILLSLLFIIVLHYFYDGDWAEISIAFRKSFSLITYYIFMLPFKEVSNFIVDKMRPETVFCPSDHPNFSKYLSASNYDFEV